MKNLLPILWIIIVLSVTSCANSQSEKESNFNLSPVAFAEKMKREPQAAVIDVRTPKEFAEGTLLGAVNINWKDSGFGKNIQAYDKSKPLLVYCRSGARSAEAADMMRTQGFQEVYELEGGILKWRDAGMKVERD